MSDQTSIQVIRADNGSAVLQIGPLTIYLRFKYLGATESKPKSVYLFLPRAISTDKITLKAMQDTLAEFVYSPEVATK